jgi:hypothetical protein
MRSRRRERELEAALVMAEVKLACLLVDHRDDPRMQPLLAAQRDKLVDFRQRLQNEGPKSLGLRIRVALRRLSLAAAFGRA